MSSNAMTFHYYAVLMATVCARLGTADENELQLDSNLICNADKLIAELEKSDEDQA